MNKHMAQDVSDLLAECLAAAKAGGTDLDQCLARHVQHEAVLQELVPLAMELQQIPTQSPSAAFQSNGYRNLMREIEREPGWCWQLRRLLQSPTSLSAGNRPRLASAWVGVLVAVILCVGVSSTVLAAEGALPGDPLYGIKTTVEDVRLAVTPAEGDVGLQAHFAERRIDEIKALVAAGRLFDVPKAAARYQTNVGQALQALATAGDQNTSVRDRLADELDRTLSEQTIALNALSSQMPAQVAPAIQQAQLASTDARNVIKQLRAEPGTGGTAEPPSPAPTQPLPGGTVPPLGDTPAAPPAASTPVPPSADTPTAPAAGTPVAPRPTSTSVPPSADTPAASPSADTPAAPPAVSTPVPPPVGTSVAPPPASTSAPPPASTSVAPPPGGTSVPPPARTSAPPPPAGTPAPPPSTP